MDKYKPFILLRIRTDQNIFLNFKSHLSLTKYLFKLSLSVKELMKQIHMAPYFYYSMVSLPGGCVQLR